MKTNETDLHKRKAKNGNRHYLVERGTNARSVKHVKQGFTPEQTAVVDQFLGESVTFGVNIDIDKDSTTDFGRNGLQMQSAITWTHLMAILSDNY
jgi:hypothetical protein